MFLIKLVGHRRTDTVDGGSNKYRGNFILIKAEEEFDAVILKDGFVEYVSKLLYHQERTAHNCLHHGALSLQ